MSQHQHQRITILGPHSTGKTTLARALAKRLPGFALVEETARKVMERDGWTRDDVPNPAFQRAILNDQIISETAASLPYITDRCALDPIAYTLSLHPSSTLHLDLLALPSLQALLTAYRDPSSLVILLEPVAEFVKDDGVRSLWDSDERWELLRTFEKVLLLAGVKGYRKMGSEMRDLEKRCRRVERWLGGELE